MQTQEELDVKTNRNVNRRYILARDRCVKFEEGKCAFANNKRDVSKTSLYVRVECIDFKSYSVD